MPALQLIEIRLGEDALARCVRYRDAADAERSQHGTCSLFVAAFVVPFVARLFPGALHGHDELLFLRGPARLFGEHVLQSYQNILDYWSQVDDLDIFPMTLQVFRHESPVTMMRLIFTAQETAHFDVGRMDCILNPSLGH